MVNKKFKYTGTTYHRMAVLHAIGQLEQMFGYAKLSDIARFMNMSKQAAQRHIKRLIDSYEIVVIKSDKIGRGGFDKYILHYDMLIEYQSGEYKQAYDIYAIQLIGQR